ncbi:MAG: acyl carrier protein [Brevundimonas sp.]|nr:acyl carrier protein [Brevundimonas sp.]
MTSTADRVRKRIAESLGVVIASDACHIVDDLGADSLETVALVMDIEEEFGIEIPDDEMADLGTVGETIAIVERLIGGVA